MKTQRVLHQMVLLVLLVQLFAPLITAQPAQASPSAAPPSTPLLYPPPLAAQAESALQQAQAHTPPQAPPAAQLDDILPPGTIPAAAPLAQNLDQRVYLPLVVGGSGSAADPATERIDLRTRYAKVFQRPDGSGYALSYAAPIHYIDTTGAWAEIDNTLVSDLQQQGVYQNAANDITVSIAADPDTAALQAGFNVAALSFAQGDTRFTLAPQTSRAVTGTVHGAIITFADIARDTALHYAPLADGVFIGVQLESRAATQQPITFDLTAPGLVISHTDALLQLTGDDAILTFSAVAIDARQRMGAVTVAVLDQGSGQYVLTLEPDRDWLRTASPVFPISLELLGTSISTDPALAATSIQGVVEDTYAQERFPTISTWNQARLYLGYDPSTGPNGGNWKAVTRTFIQYGFPALPPGSVITSARARLFQYISQAGTYQTRVSRVVGQNWAPLQNDGNLSNDLTWNTQPTVTDERCCTEVDASIDNFKAWDITDYARAWQTGTPNYGILIQSANEGMAGGSIFWAARTAPPEPEQPPNSVHPYLQIDFTENPILSMQTDMSFAPGSTVAQGTDVTASFVVRNNGGGAYNGPIQANTGAAPNFAQFNVGIGPLGGTYNYANTVRFNNAASYYVCATFAGGTIPAGSGQPCLTLNVVPPADLQLDSPLSVSPRDLPPEGGTATAQFTVINTNGSLPAEGRVRALVKNSFVSFNETSSIRLNPSERFTYNTSNFYATPGVYEVEAQHLPLNESTWRPLIGQGSAFLRVQNPPPPPREAERGYPPHCGIAGDPVNTSTGNFFADATDLQEPAVGLPMAVTRWYNALDAADVAGPFGFGTAWAYDMRVTYRNDKSALVRMTDGSVAYFLGDLTIGNPLDLAGTYIGQGEDIGTLVRATDGTSVLTLPDQTNYHFDANGRIVRISHPHPSEITVTYSGALPVSIQHSAGITYTMTYSNGLITELASSTGRSVQYTYANGDLVEVTRPDGSTYRYEYDANHRLTAAFTPNGNAYVRNFYDAQGRVVRQLDQDGTESFFTYGADITLPRVFTDTLGFTTTHFYDADYRLIREIDALGHITTYTRDAQSNIIAKQDRTGAVWQWTYDTRGNMLTATDPLGNVTTYEYDARNNRTAMIDPLGQRTEYTYDANNRMIAERDALGHTRTFAYDSMGNLIFERDKTGGETRYLHNAQGLPISITNALGQTTLMAYDAFGNTAVYTDAEGRIATFDYDELNRLMDSSDPISASFPLAYDTMGNLLEETDALGEAMTYEYDAFDRITAQRDFRGNTTTYAYDALGRTTAITNTLGETTRSVYDPVGNLVETVAPDGTSTTYEYDPEQRLIRETDALGRATEYVYDAAGRQIETRDPCDPAVCPTGFAVERTTYDAASRATARQDARGAVTQTEYDALNRVARVIYPDGSSVAYSYDEAGRQIQEVDQVGAVSRIFYDDLGQPINTTTPLGFTTVMTFDAVGNVLAETNKRGATTTYTYDANDRPVAVTDALGNPTSTTYDAEGRMVGMTDPLGRTSRYEYDANGNQIRTIDPRGNARTTTYDSLDRPRRECDALAQCREMTYDDMGRMVAETDALGRTTATSMTTSGARCVRLARSATRPSTPTTSPATGSLWKMRRVP
ncbi:MAG: DNRLRE domain-containing protein [Chloroflexaceae bacterium]|nr:DNRLRE domain-containing protein [Chloroflexaceae bacterium]